jgi:hypothetical protein
MQITGSKNGMALAAILFLTLFGTARAAEGEAISICRAIQLGAAGGAVQRQVVGIVEQGGHGSALRDRTESEVEIRGVRVPCLLFMDSENDPKRVAAINQKLRKVRRAKGKPLVLEVVGLVESEASRAVTVIQKDQRLRHGYGDQAGYAGVIVVRDVVRQISE